MYDELTKEDIKKMQEELDYRTRVLRPQLIDDVKVARGFGDLSENFEYKAAKREKNRNDSRVRYLERMIKTAKVISDDSADGVAGLYDHVTIRAEDDESERVITLVTTLRQNAPQGLISKESPVGKAVMGRRAGDRVYIDLGGDDGYWLDILKVEKGEDDGSIPIRGY
mgnify:FL=1